MSKQSQGEWEFEQFTKSDDWPSEIPIPVREYRYNPNGRKWRGDFAWPDFWVSLEIQGGQFTRGGHARIGESQKEFYRFNALQIAGWIVLQVAPADIGSADLLKQIKQALRARGWSPGV